MYNYNIHIIKFFIRSKSNQKFTFSFQFYVKFFTFEVLWFWGRISYGRGDDFINIFRVSFEFSDATLNRLVECVGYMKRQEGKSSDPLNFINQPEIRRKGWTKIVIGRHQITQNCTLSVVMLLMEICEGRVDLDLNYLQWEDLIRRHIQARDARRLNPWTFGEAMKERGLLYHAIKHRQFFLVKALLENGCPANDTFHVNSIRHSNVRSWF